jgi:DNA modification methylase
MTPHYTDDWLTVYGGDCREVLASLPADSVDCVVTSPPYWGLRDYGSEGQLGLERTPEEYVANMVAVFAEVRRVLKPSGTCWLNLGDSYTNRSPGNHNDPKTNRSAHTVETVERDCEACGQAFIGGPMQRFCGTACSGKDNTPRAKRGLLKDKDLVGIPWRVAFALQADGWYLRSDIIWSKPNPMPESVTDRPTKAHEYLFLLTKSARYYFDADAVREDAISPPGSRAGYSGYSKRAEAMGREPSGNEKPGMVALNGTGRNIRSVWTIATRPYPGAHFAVFPPELPERCIKAGSPANGVVLDPFGGSGTVGMVANRLSRRAILIDLNPGYLQQQMKRNAQVPLGM